MARASVIFFWLIFMTKITGQRQIGRLTLLDFIISITIGSIAAGTLNNSRTNLLIAMLTIATLTIIDLLLNYISLKYSKIRRIFQGEPIILIKNGELLEDTMRKAKINLDDLLMELRLKKLPNLADTEFAVLEPNGKISVIPKSQARGVKTKDLNINTRYEGYPIIIIEDGNILEDNLKENNLDKDWVYEELKKQGIDNEQQVLAAMLDTEGRFFISKK
ncbi:MAG: YetF domain-containing protein [Halanaerobiaceae bacterium]